MSVLLFHVFLVPETEISRDEGNSGEIFFFTCGTCALCASSCFSINHLSLARLWPRPRARTPPWPTCFWQQTTSALKGQRLGVWSVR